MDKNTRDRLIAFIESIRDDMLALMDRLKLTEHEQEKSDGE